MSQVWQGVFAKVSSDILDIIFAPTYIADPTYNLKMLKFEPESPNVT